MKYDELVKALRHCTVDAGGFADCRGCPEEGHSFDCETKLHQDAAAAIEALEDTVQAYKHQRDEYAKSLEAAKAEVEKPITIEQAIDRLREIGGKYALVTMCIGGGMGVATVFEKV